MNPTENHFQTEAFLEKLSQRTKDHPIPPCPYCGEKDFTTLPEFGAIVSGSSFRELKLGPAVPCGMMICKNCGHVDFFALGILGLLPQPEQMKEKVDHD